MPQPKSAYDSSYKQTYHRSVTAVHSARTAEKEAAFVLPHLFPHYRILDVGCGPGSITTGFSKYVTAGSVTGIDFSEEVLEQARSFALSQGQPQTRFEVGNILEGLKYPDASFDVVFCNQTLIHIPDPVKALREMKRVCAPGGFVACREADMPWKWHPYLPGLQLWDKYMYGLLFGMTDSPHPQNLPHGPEYRGGSLIHVWARQAGFDPTKMKKGADVELYSSEQERKWFGESYIARIEHGGAGDKFRKLDANEEELQTILADLRAWMNDVDGWFSIFHGEIICPV
ncbi:putative ubiE/COQ5 methyltransferase [Delitschia confertaspora ATCC 74209]|uniref:UbiE/COQ5 methyltransferase n=1 Tax=Delitschia confertaspora ATCC 74209 TaxID=1513339 RepID=A0A9P4JSD8_9PLEO|nr:putative ubiE/COQ5 methyltransferase [Delitschia confertaspora ATCC 74209]